MITKLWYGINRIVDNVSWVFQDLLLLCIRLYWGWQFYLTGSGKLSNIDAVAENFVKWGIPAPRLNVMLAGTTECVGGLFLLAGLLSRLTTIPLMVTMIVAYITADHEALVGAFSKPDDFFSAAPFLFLYASAIIFACGPGRISLDELLSRIFRRR